jgi:selT/selW/selH-like putative selenoprotein
LRCSPSSQGYLAFALQLKKALVRHIPDVRVELREGPRSSFEIERDGVRIFSKLKKGRLPDFQRVVDEVRSFPLRSL